MNTEDSLTAGQSACISPDEGGGWASDAPSRRSPKPRRSKRSLSSASYPVKTTRPTQSSRRTKDPDYIRRPENSFILFRKHYVRNRDANEHIPPGQTLSKFVAEVWKNLPADAKMTWHRMSIEGSREHARKYPHYKYDPVRRKPVSKKKTDVEHKIEESSVTFHSTESSPAPLPVPASDLMTDNTTAPPSFPSSDPSNDNATITTSIHPQFIQRKQSFRLSNWDDSVLCSQAHSASFHCGGLSHIQGGIASTPEPTNWAWEASRRRSSSAPVPDYSALANYCVSDPVVGSCQGDTHARENEANLAKSYYHPLSHRFSCSNGVRSGFVYQDTVSPTEGKDVTVHGHLNLSETLLSLIPDNIPAERPVDPNGIYDASYPQISQVQDNTTVAPSALRKLQHALAWSDRSTSHSPPTITPPSMFVSPIQSLPCPSYLDVEENDRQFNQYWSELAFCSSPEHIPISIPTSTDETESVAPLDTTATSIHFDVPSRTEFSCNVAEECRMFAEREAEQVVPAIPRRAQERHPWSLALNMYSSAPRKPVQSLTQVSILTEDVLGMENGFGGYGFDDPGSQSPNIDPIFSIAPMDSLFDFYATSQDGSSSSGSPWFFSDDADGA